MVAEEEAVVVLDLPRGSTLEAAALLVGAEAEVVAVLVLEFTLHIFLHRQIAQAKVAKEVFLLVFPVKTVLVEIVI